MALPFSHNDVCIGCCLITVLDQGTRNGRWSYLHLKQLDQPLAKLALVQPPSGASAFFNVPFILVVYCLNLPLEHAARWDRNPPELRPFKLLGLLD